MSNQEYIYDSAPNAIISGAAFRVPQDDVEVRLDSLDLRRNDAALAQGTEDCRVTLDDPTDIAHDDGGEEGKQARRAVDNQPSSSSSVATDDDEEDAAADEDDEDDDAAADDDDEDDNGRLHVRPSLKLWNEAWDPFVLPNTITRYYVLIRAVNPDGEILTSQLFIPATLQSARDLTWEFWNTTMERIRQRFAAAFKPSQSNALKTIAYVFAWFARDADLAVDRDVVSLWQEMQVTFEGMGVASVMTNAPGEHILHNLLSWAQAKIEDALPLYLRQRGHLGAQPQLLAWDSDPE